MTQGGGFEATKNAVFSDLNAKYPNRFYSQALRQTILRIMKKECAETKAGLDDSVLSLILTLTEILK